MIQKNYQRKLEKKFIKFDKIYNLINKNKDLKKKIVGGYYPVNNEVDDLRILQKFEKKK